MPKFYTSEDRQRYERLLNDSLDTALEDDTMRGYAYGKPNKSTSNTSKIKKKGKKKKSKWSK